ncbi:MAG: DUF4857 domain-containing protein [Rikenellaceae bacterium]
MKKPNRLLFIVILLTTFAMMFVLPPLVRKATVSNDKYPFVYYSSQLKELCLIDYSNKETPMESVSGQKYSTTEFDSLVPLLNYRQLMSDGRLPDSICGVSAEPRNLMLNSVVLRYEPKEMLKPTTGIYAMLETMPTRVGLKQPTDLFRIHDKIEFIDAATNTIDYKKSELFQKEMLKRGYQFPTQLAKGDANTRKSYDEGYFCLDAKGDLYHVKMVNGRPFVKNTEASKEIDIAYFATYNPASKRFYGYMLSKQGEMFILESDEQGGYRTLKLDIGIVDIENEKVQIMGNILYWTISITNNNERRFVALRSDDLSSVASYTIDREQNAWDAISKYVLPFSLSFEDENSEYIYPRISFAGVGALCVSIFLALLSLFIWRREQLKTRIFSALLIAISGVAGLIAVAILPKFKNH